MNIGWIQVEVLSNPSGGTFPQEGAGFPQEGAVASVPFLFSSNTLLREERTTPEVHQKQRRRKTEELKWISEKQRESFDEFWGRYWRKEAKIAGAEAYIAKVLTVKTHSEVMAGVERQRDGMMTRPPESRPHASTWLNQTRWKDEEELPAVEPKSKLERMADGVKL
jgi:hypothetical protein